MKHLLSSTSFIIVNKRLATRVGLKEAILLADLISKEQYFIDNDTIKNGWFFNTAKNIEKDTTLSRHKQSLAIKKLVKKGFIKTKLMGVPATLHFKIIDDKILKFLKTGIKETSKLDVKKLKTNKNKEIIITNNKSLSIRAQEFTEEVNKICSCSVSGYSGVMWQEFIDYWTETNKTKTKMKYEMQRTFDISLRLKRWAKNSKNWNKGISKIDNQINEYLKGKELL